MTLNAVDRLFAQLDRMEEKLNGNGGVFPRLQKAEDNICRMQEERKEREAQIAEEKRLAAEERKQNLNDKKDSFWRKIGLHAATVFVTLLLTAVWINYINRRPSPVEKVLSVEEQQIKDETKQEFDELRESIKDLSERLKPASLPASAPKSKKPVTPKVRRSSLAPGEMIVGDLPPFYSSARVMSESVKEIP